MANRDVRIAVVAAVAGILGTVVGAVGGAITNGFMTAHVQQEERRMKSTLESFRFDQMDRPVEFLQIKQFLDALRDLSVIGGPSIVKMAQLARRYPNCWNSLADECEEFYIQSIQVMREELKAGRVEPDDIKMLLHGKFSTAGKAAKQVQGGAR
ncbi:MAG: hypothetical protein WEG40_15955 [Candidatus Rokuibacteriota bacterium]